MRFSHLPRLLPTLVIMGGLLAAPISAVQANSKYPEKPISLVVAFPAGTTTDAVGRIFATELSDMLGQPVIVENKPGGNATIAAKYVARAKPDGYTLFVTSNTSHSAAPWLMKNVGYDPIKDFTPIARGGNLPFVLLVNPGVAAKTVQDLVALAKEKPGSLTYASGNSTGILAGATLGNRADIDILHVPYRGSPQALTDLIGGRVDLLFNDLTSSLPFIESGQVRALAVSTADRSAIAPELPSMQESGVKDFNLVSWNGYFGPAGMSPEVVERLNTAINEIVKKPEVRDRLAKLGFDAFSSTPAEFEEFVGGELVAWGKLIKEAGIEPQ